LSESPTSCTRRFRPQLPFNSSPVQATHPETTNRTTTTTVIPNDQREPGNPQLLLRSSIPEPIKSAAKQPFFAIFTQKILRSIKKATYSLTRFHVATKQFIYTKVTSAALLTFYARCDPDRCQPSRGRTTIPGSSIGDISPCVEPLFLLSSQSFTNERRAYRLARTRSASIWHGMPTALVRNKPFQN